MRTLGALTLALLLIASVPAGAHPGEIHHGEVFRGTLTPGGSVTQPLSFEEGPLIAGWVFMLGAKVQGGRLDAELSTGGATAATFIIPPTDRWVETMALPITGTYELTLRNQGSADVTFAVYFDQSCNCVGKFIPPEISTGMVIFNVDTFEPSTVFAQLNEPRAMEVKVSAALRTNSRSQWPEDFRVLAVSEAPVQRQAGPDVPPVLLHELQVSVSEATRVYFFVEGISLKTNNPPPEDLFITPFYDIRPISGGISPWVWVGVAAAVAGAGAIILWRGRQKPEFAKSPKNRGKDAITRRGDARGVRHTQRSQRSRR